MNAVIRDMAEKLVVAIHTAIKSEEPLKEARDNAFNAYSKANDAYMRSRKDIAELCGGLDAIVPPPATYPMPSTFETTRGPSQKYMMVRDRCHELRAIAERNKKLDERQHKEAEERKAKGEPVEYAMQAPEPVL